MKSIESKAILKIFEKLNSSKLNYLLLRNINNELPNNLKVGKDIDLLVRREEKDLLVGFFLDNKFKKIRHPYENDNFLYNASKFDFLLNGEDHLLFDLNYQITVRSLDTGFWLPIDQTIQESVWENKRFEQINQNFGFWTLSYDDEFITLIARAVFDKRQFNIEYITRLEELYKMIPIELIIDKLGKIFFKYTPYLLEKIEKKDYSNIIKEYIEFREY